MPATRNEAIRPTHANNRQGDVVSTVQKSNPHHTTQSAPARPASAPGVCTPGADVCWCFRMVAHPVDRRLFISLSWQTSADWSGIRIRDTVSRDVRAPPSRASSIRTPPRFTLYDEALGRSVDTDDQSGGSPATLPGRRPARGKNSDSHSDNIAAHETSTLTGNPNPVTPVQESVNSRTRTVEGLVRVEMRPPDIRFASASEPAKSHHSASPTKHILPGGNWHSALAAVYVSLGSHRFSNGPRD